jgi:hypothetical protein
LERLTYALAQRDAEGSTALSPSDDKKSGTSAALEATDKSVSTLSPTVDVVEAFYSRCNLRLGPDHATSIASAFRYVLFLKRAAGHARGSSSGTAATGMKLQAEMWRIVREALTRCERVLGEYSQLHVIGLAAAGEARLVADGVVAGDAEPNPQRGALTYFSRALAVGERLLGYHPLVARLCSIVGRLYLSLGERECTFPFFLGTRYLAHVASLPCAW